MKMWKMSPPKRGNSLRLRRASTSNSPPRPVAASSALSADPPRRPPAEPRPIGAAQPLPWRGRQSSRRGETPAASTLAENVHTWKCFACGGEHVGDAHLETLEHKRKMGALWVELATGEDKKLREYAKTRLCVYKHYEPNHPVFENVQLCGSPANGSWSPRINPPSTTPAAALP